MNWGQLVLWAIANAAKLKGLPGISAFGEWVSSLANRFTVRLRDKGILAPRELTVVIARFEGDTSGQYERRIRALGVPLHGVRFVTRDPITSPGKTYEWATAQNRERRKALALLRNGADVVLYGSTLDASRVKLEMVAGPEPQVWYAATVALEDDGLPVSVLRFVVAALGRNVSTQIERISSASDGKHTTSELRFAVRRVYKLLANDMANWPKCTYQQVLVAAGRSLMLGGARQGNLAYLSRSVWLLRESARLTCDRAWPAAFAHTRFFLAKALNELGQVASDTDALTESYQLLSELLSSTVMSRAVMLRSRVIGELSVVAVGLFERMGGVRWLDAADRAANECLEIALQSGARNDHEVACINRAAVLYLRWCRTHEPRIAERGVYYAELGLASGRLKRDAPLFAAAARHNVAIMKHALALHRTGAERKRLLTESERDFQRALATRKMRKVPLLWAESAVALAALRVRIAAESGRPNEIRQQIVVLAKVERLLRRTRATHALLAALERRAGAYVALTDFESPPKALNRAQQIYVRMLRVLHAHGGSPFQVAVTTAAMGEVQAQLGNAKFDLELLAAASEAYAVAAPVLDSYHPEYAQLCRNGITELARRIEQLKHRHRKLGAA